MKGILALIGVIALATPAMAATIASGGGAGLLVWFFIGFVALFIVSQLIPGIILTVGLIRGLFSRHETGKGAPRP